MKVIAGNARTGAVLLLLLVGILYGTHAAAATLEGTVRGSSGAPKRYVQVDTFGKQNVKTFTDQSGKFMMELPEGEYTIQISERDRVMTFKVRVSGTDKQDQTFDLKWR